MTKDSELRPFLPSGRDGTYAGDPGDSAESRRARKGTPGEGKTVPGSAGEAFSRLRHGIRAALSDRALLLQILLHIGAAALAFFLCGASLPAGRISHMAGDALSEGIGHPLGLALLAAAGSYFPAVLAGVTLAVLRFGEGRGVYLASVLVCAGLRYLAGRLLGAGAREEDELWEEEDAEENFSAEYPVRADGMPSRDGTPLLRTLFPPGIFRGHTASVRVGCAVAAACPAAAAMLLAGGFAGSALTGAVLYLFLLPFLTYLFCGLTEDGIPSPAHREAGIGALAWAAVISCGDALIIGFSVKIMAAYLITLYLAKTGGFLRGGLCGLLCGLACDTLYAPAFALAGAVSGVFFGLHAAPAVILSVLSASAYALYVGAFPALRLIVPELVCSGAIAYPAARYLRLGRLLRTTPEGTGASPAVLSPKTGGISAEREYSPVRAAPETLGLPGTDERLDALSGVLLSLSSAVSRLSGSARRPSLGEVRSLCETTAERFCQNCERRGSCREQDPACADAMGRIALCIHRKGRAEPGPAFAPLDTRCAVFPELLSAVNAASGELCTEKLAHDRLSVAAEDYDGMAALLRASAEDDARECTEDMALSGRLGRAMGRMGFRAERVSVYGERRRVVVVSGVELGAPGGERLFGGTQREDARVGRVMRGAEDVRAAFSALAGVRYQMPDYALRPETDGSRALDMTLRAVPKLTLSCGCFGEKKDGEAVTGDAVSCFANRGDYYYVLLCDGMGSGREASVTARLCTLYLEKLLSASHARGAALKLLNGLLRAREDESSAALDLCEIDTLTGNASFVKCGAAPSYLIRGDSIFRVASGTAPLGILGSVNAEETAFTLCGGDLLLFLSDGVCGEKEDAAWILRTARAALRTAARVPDPFPDDKKASGTDTEGRGEKKQPLDRAAEYFVRAARERSGGADDDMTAVFVRVREIRS